MRPTSSGDALPSGSVTFNAGETSKVITINVNGDTTVEPDEAFTVTLSGPVDGTISTAIGRRHDHQRRRLSISDRHAFAGER